MAVTRRRSYVSEDAMSRRDFLVVAGAVAATVAAGPYVAAASPTDTAVAVGAGRGWRVVSPMDRLLGFAVKGASVHNPMGDHIGAKAKHGKRLGVPMPAAMGTGGHLVEESFNIKFVCKARRGQGGTWEQVWQDTDGHVHIHARIDQKGDALRFRVEVYNGWAFNIRGLTFQLPMVLCPDPQHSAVLDGCCGGRERRWANGRANDGLGYYRYSSVAAFYDRRSTAGVAVEYFDDLLRNFELHWDTHGGQCQPRLDCSYFSLQKGRRATFDFGMRAYSHGMPEIGLDDYRTYSLAPFMKRYDMPESPAFKATSPWAQSGWPNGGNLPKMVEYCKSLGAKGYIQWAPPSIPQYEPFPERIGWFSGVKKASELGVPLGVLIDPNFSPMIGQSAAAWKLDQKYVPMGMTPLACTAASQAYLLKMRDNLAANGVTVAYWDTGGLPNKGWTPEQFLTLLRQWKQAGISIMPEASRDHSSWITGVAFNWGLPSSTRVYGGPLFTFATPPRCQILKRVTPNVKMFRGGINPPTLAGNPHWWNAFNGDPTTILLLSAGVYVPQPAQLVSWAKEHRDG